MVSNSRRAAADDGGGARIAAGLRRAPDRRPSTANGGAERLPQRDRQRQAGKAGAADQHIDALRAG